MTRNDKINIMNRINAYADEVLAGVALTDKKVSWQLDQLRPIMEELAAEYHTDLVTIFMTYMDYNSERVAKAEMDYQRKVSEMDF